MTKSDLQFLKDHLELLRIAGLRAKQVTGPYNEFGAATTLKLICIEYWQRIYSDIMTDHLKGRRKSSLAYLDVMSGSGLNRIRGTEHYVGGSTILSCIVPRPGKPFHRILAIEKSKARAKALERRLALLREPDTYRVFPKEADAAIDDALSDLGARNAHFLAFVDYEGVKGFSRDSMEKLLEKDCDIWFTYFPNIKRAWEREREWCRPLFGDIVDKAINYEDALMYFGDWLRTKREIVLDVPIRGEGGYQYFLFYMTRRTWGGSPYARAAENLGQRLSGIGASFARVVLDILSGTQTSFDAEWSATPTTKSP